MYRSSDLHFGLLLLQIRSSGRRAESKSCVRGRNAVEANEQKIFLNGHERLGRRIFENGGGGDCDIIIAGQENYDAPLVRGQVGHSYQPRTQALQSKTLYLPIHPQLSSLGS